MKIHEYQGKQLFQKYGVPVPIGIPAMTVEEALAAWSTGLLALDVEAVLG